MYKRLMSFSSINRMRVCKYWRLPRLLLPRRSQRLRKLPRINYKTWCLKGPAIRLQPEVSEKGTLGLYLNPPPRVSEEPYLEGLPFVDLLDSNILPGEVCGVRCKFFVDSDTNTPLMSHHLASQLGLLPLIKEFKTETMSFWYGDDEVRLGLLKNVHVRLGPDIDLYVNYYVFSAENDISDDIILDCTTLRMHGVIQTFSKTGSRLYFRKPAGTKPRRSPSGFCTEYVLEAHLQKDLKDPYLGIVVDSGAPGFYISEECRSGILSSTQCKVVKRVAIKSADGRTFLKAVLDKVPNDDWHFVLGSGILGQYHCIVDYHCGRFYFKNGVSVYKTMFRPL